MHIENRRAKFDYEILSTIEAGIVLTGGEARAIREKRVNITNSYVKVVGNELMLINAHFGTVEMGDTLSSRSRKLLVHKREMLELNNRIKQERLTIVPLSVYTKGRYYKMSLGLGKAKKQFNKKQKVKDHDIERNTQREFRGEKDNEDRR